MEENNLKDPFLKEVFLSSKWALRNNKRIYRATENGRKESLTLEKETSLTLCPKVYSRVTQPSP